MNRTLRLPLIPVLFIYTIGIYFGHFNPPISTKGYIFFIIALLSLWAFFLFTRRARIGSVLAALSFFFIGLLSIHLYLNPSRSEANLLQFIGHDRILLEGTIDRTPYISKDRVKIYIHSNKVLLSNHQIPVQGNLLLFLREGKSEFRLGDRIRFLCKLYPPRGFHNPGGFSYERYLSFERVDAIAFLSEEKIWAKIGEGYHNPFLLIVEGWRERIRQFLEREAGIPYSAIFQALVLGEQGMIPEEVKEYFIVTGIAHLLAISGDHLGIVGLLSFSIFIWIFKRFEWIILSISIKRLAAGLTIPCIILYTLIAGSGISVIRATIMVVTFLLSIIFQRERNLLHTLALSAFIILLFSPPSLFDVSFQLSFLSVLSILYLVPKILKAERVEEIPLPPTVSWKEKIWRYLKISLLVTGTAILGTAPFVSLHFNRISLIGVFTNIFAIPWVGFFIVPISLMASMLSFLFYPLATFLISINQFLAKILLTVVELCASIPHASIFVSTPTAFEIVLFYSLLGISVHLRRRKNFKYIFLTIIFIFIIDFSYWNFKDLFKRDLSLTFIDVGHGDSILIEFPKGKRMLIDGGGLPKDDFDIGKNVVAPFLWKKKIKRIDILVLTHPDPDHLKGLNFIASQFSIGQFWESGLKISSESYNELEKTLLKRNIKRFSLNEASSPKNINGVEITVINPPKIYYPGVPFLNPSYINNHSLVLKLKYKKISILLLGDIEHEAELRISRRDDLARVDILKVPHHGSLSSSNETFLERVRPAYAIFSTSERTRGKLPHPDVLRRYERLGSKILRTDRDGAITIVTDGEKIEVKTFFRKDI